MHCPRNAPVNHWPDPTALAPGMARPAAEAAKRGGLRAARLRAAKAYIVENSCRQGVSVGTAAADLGVTPRSLQRLLESDGTSFTAALLGQRLTRAYRMLCNPQLSDRTVSSVAYDAGFGDLSYFNRCFRRRFGTTPGEIRRAGSRLHQELAQPAALDSIGA